jgi:hypothetical protein
MQTIHLNLDHLRQTGVDEAHRIVHNIAASAPAALRAPVNIAKEQIAAAETAFRANFGGFDASLSSVEARKRLLNRYKELFALLDVRGMLRCQSYNFVYVLIDKLQAVGVYLLMT